MATELDKYFQVAVELVKKGGQLVRSAYDQPASVVHTKTSSVDLVTETDQAVEKLLIGGLSAAFPDHKFIGEESAAAGQKYTFTDAPTWIIDPIDGTTNFVHRIPMIAICVGLSIKKNLVIGIIYNPILNELFTAIQGRGAFKNGFPIHVSKTEKLQNAVVITQLGSRGVPEVNSFLKSIQTFMVDKQAHGHRAFGSAAINIVYTAQGSTDAYIEYGLHSWDVAAAVVIHREAGGVVIDPSGEPFDLMRRRILVAGTDALAREISQTFTHTEFEREGEDA